MRVAESGAQPQPPEPSCATSSVASAFVPALSLFAPSDAAAYVYIGNPALGVRIEWPSGTLTQGAAKLDFVRVFACGGGYTDYQVDAWIDPVEGWSTTIDGGDPCGVGLRWDTDVFVHSSTFVLRYEEIATGFTLPGPSTATYAPFVVVSGSFSGSDPAFLLTLE